MNDYWFEIPRYASELFVANHDNERGSADRHSSIFKLTPGRFSLHSLDHYITYPYGMVRQIYSGYEFKAHDDAGPVNAERCTGGRNCEHWDSIVNNAVGFAWATRGLPVRSKGKLIGFNRGGNGFYALNAGDKDVTMEFQVEMADGADIF
jgi:hypothetical protein